VKEEKKICVYQMYFSIHKLQNEKHPTKAITKKSFHKIKTQFFLTKYIF